MKLLWDEVYFAGIAKIKDTRTTVRAIRLFGVILSEAKDLARASARRVGTALSVETQVLFYLCPRNRPLVLDLAKSRARPSSLRDPRFLQASRCPRLATLPPLDGCGQSRRSDPCHAQRESSGCLSLAGVLYATAGEIEFAEFPATITTRNPHLPTAGAVGILSRKNNGRGISDYCVADSASAAFTSGSSSPVSCSSRMMSHPPTNLPSI